LRGDTAGAGTGLPPMACRSLARGSARQRGGALAIDANEPPIVDALRGDIAGQGCLGYSPVVQSGRVRYVALRRSASEFLKPPSMRICTAATAIITAAVTRCTTASVVLLGKLKT
jgi:hypothetical protein